MNTKGPLARFAAFKAVQAVLDQRGSLDSELARFNDKLSAKDQTLARLVASLTCRHYFQLKAVFDGLVPKPLKAKDQAVETLALTGLAQLAYSNQADYAVVKDTVALVQRIQRPWARGLVNAVLRSFQRDTSKWLMHRPTEAARWNHPDWLMNRLKQAYPDAFQEIMSANNQRAPMTLRVNVQKSSQVDYLSALAEQDLTGYPRGMDGIELAEPTHVAQLPGFDQGWVSVQDASAQQCVDLFDLRPGLRVLDACAAPGGKTCHLLEREPELDLIALDISADRLKRIEENLTRLQLKAQLEALDAREWQGQADRILLDAPCTGSGVIRRHPDIRIGRQPPDLVECVATQSQLLDHLWTQLAPGVQLLYATCSVLPEENSDQISAFLSRTPDAQDETPEIEGTIPGPEGRQRLPGPDGDGFYYALLVKSPPSNGATE